MVVQDQHSASEACELHALKLMSEGHSPERWFAMNAHTVHLDRSFDYRYADPQVDTWMRSVAALSLDRTLDRDRFRRKHLTWREHRQVRANMLKLTAGRD